MFCKIFLKVFVLLFLGVLVVGFGLVLVVLVQIMVVLVFNVMNDNVLFVVWVKVIVELQGKDGYQVIEMCIGKGKQDICDIFQLLIVVIEKFIDDCNFDNVKEVLKNIVGIMFQVVEGGEEDIKIYGILL